MALTDRQLEQLMRFASGKLPSERAQKVAAWLADSPEAQAWERFFRAAKTSLYPEDLDPTRLSYMPSERLWDWAKSNNPFAPPNQPIKKPLIAHLKMAWQKLADRLPSFDPGLTPAFATRGLRMGFRGQAWPALELEAGPYQVRVEVSEIGAGQQAQLFGEISGLPAEAAPTVSLRHPKWDPQTVAADNMGNFLFHAVPTDDRQGYELIIDLPNEQVIIENLNIG